MKYDIKITYDTGDSYNTYSNVEKMLGLEMDDLVLVKENLKRIKEHYDFYKADRELSRGFYSKGKNRKLELEKAINQAKQKPWYSDKYPDMTLILVLDDCNPFQVGAFWCGYFETLKCAEIIQDQSDMKITFE